MSISQVDITKSTGYETKIQLELKVSQDKVMKPTLEWAQDLLDEAFNEEQRVCYIEGKQLILFNIDSKQITDSNLKVIDTILKGYRALKGLKIIDRAPHEDDEMVDEDDDVYHLDVISLIKLLVFLQNRCEELVSFAFIGIGRLFEDMNQGKDEKCENEISMASQSIFPEVMKLLKSMPRLTSLNFRMSGGFFNYLTEKQLIEFSDYFLESKIKKMDASNGFLFSTFKTILCPAQILLSSFANSKTLTELDLSSNKLGSDKYLNEDTENSIIDKIASIIRNNHFIEKLNLSHNFLTRYKKAFPLIVEAIQQNTTLIYLDLFGNQISEDSHFLQITLKALAAVPSLIDMDLFFKDFEIDRVRYSDKLIEADKLKMLFDFISKSKLLALAFGSRQVSPLHYLEFSQAILKNNTLSILCIDFGGFYWGRTSELVVEGIGPFDEHNGKAMLKAIFTNLMSHEKLNILEFNNIPRCILRGTVDLWVPFLTNKKGLEKLIFDISEIGEIRRNPVHFKEFIAAIFKNRTITSLKLQSAYNDFEGFSDVELKIFRDLIMNTDTYFLKLDLPELENPDSDSDSDSNSKSEKYEREVKGLRDGALHKGLLKAALAIIAGKSRFSGLPDVLTAMILSFLEPNHANLIKKVIEEAIKAKARYNQSTVSTKITIKLKASLFFTAFAGKQPSGARAAMASVTKPETEVPSGIIKMKADSKEGRKKRKLDAKSKPKGLTAEIISGAPGSQAMGSQIAVSQSTLQDVVDMNTSADDQEESTPVKGIMISKTKISKR